MATWVTADWHFGHANIIKYEYRPWGSVEEMGEVLIAKLQAKVLPDDDLWVLGDVYMGRQPRLNIPSIIEQIPGRKHLVSGNHDPSFPGHKSWQSWKRWMVNEAGFAHVFDSTVLMTVSGRMIGLGHFPYEGDHTETDRHQERRPFDHGGWLLHGHVHSQWKQRARMINVGVDVWDFEPVSMDELVAIFDAE